MLAWYPAAMFDTLIAFTFQERETAPLIEWLRVEELKDRLLARQGARVVESGTTNRYRTQSSEVPRGGLKKIACAWSFLQERTPGSARHPGCGRVVCIDI